MKITVIGAGAIGSAVARHLLAFEAVTHVQVCDARARSLKELHEHVQSPRLRSFQVDARDPSVLAPILDGSAAVVGCAEPRLNPVLAEQCLALGIHYCDLGGGESVVRQELALADRARERGLWIIPNCGLDPGLTNILCAHAMDQFDEVAAAHLRVGDVPLHPEPPFNFRISWSAEKVLDDYTNPVTIIENGKLAQCEPLSHEERIQFPKPFGKMEAFCTAGGLERLLETHDGRLRALDHKLIRWPGHAAQMRFLLALGFGERRSIDVGTHLTYRDVLVRRMRQRLGGTYEDAVLLRVLVQGRKDGQDRTLVYEMIERFDAATGESAMKRCTSIPIAAVAVLVAAQQIPGGGAAPPEHVVPRDDYFRLITERGLIISSTWYEGHRAVTHPA